MGGDEPSGEDRDDWVVGVEAIVADNDDPENQHRVKVVIPSIDENLIFDKWARQLMCYVGPPGYGGFFVPDIGAEVILFGRLASKYHLLYAPVYNEDYPVPADFDGATTTAVGFRAPADMKFIAEGDMQRRAGGIRDECDGAHEIIAPGGLFVNGKRIDA
jgi:hypothetical protein